MGTTMYQLTDKRMIRTRDAIRRALLSLLSQKDAAGIKVSELTEAADISRKTFYLHYSSVNEALDELENEIEQQVLAELSQSDLRHCDLYEIISRVDRVLQQQPAYACYLSNRCSRYFMLYRLKNAVKNCVKAQMEQDTAAEEEDLDAAADFAVSGVISMYYDWLVAQQVTLRQLSDKAQKLLGGALREFLGKNNREGERNG